MPKGKRKARQSTEAAKDNTSKILSLADIVKARGTIEEIEALFSQGVAIDTDELSVEALKKYVKPLANKKLHYKLLNTIDIFQNMKNRPLVKDLVNKPHYHQVLNKKGHNLANALVTLGYEEECIALLKSYDDESITEYLDNPSIWHWAVMYNCEQVVAFLISSQPENIDCLNEKGLSPWCLSVLLNNPVISRLLQRNGANTSAFVNEDGQTLLHVAVIEEDFNLLEKCLSCDVPSNAVDIHGYTPHHYARIKEDTRLLEQLKKCQWSKFALLNDYFNSVRKGDVVALNKVLESKFNRNVRTGKKQTALDIARIHKHSAIIDVLESIAVESSLSPRELKDLWKENSKQQQVNSKFQISFKRKQNGLELSVNGLDFAGKMQNLLSIDPWSKTPKVLKHSRWKYLVKENLCYLILMDELQGNQPLLICVLNQAGDCHVTFSNLPNTSLSFETSANFKLDGLVSINQLSVSARSITSKKPFKLLNGAALKLNAKNVELNGEIVANEVNITAEDTYQQSAEVRTEKSIVNANAITISGQTLVSKQFDFVAKNKFVLTGHIATGHQGTIKANSVQLERSSSVVSQHGTLAIRSSANINNLGSIIGNHVTLHSELMITNHMGAMIKGLHCTLHAPQVNQAGFLLSGLKPTLSYVDLSLSALHAATNVAEYFSAIPTPQAIALRGYLLLSKTLYRGGDLLYRAINGDEIDNKSIITLVLDNVLPSIGFLSSTDEKATLLLNVLYQFYGSYSSDDKFIYKSLEFIEALTRTISVVSGGLLSDENLEWLQLATKMLNGSRHALKLAEVGANAIRAWHSDDQIELDRAQEKFKTITEMAFREALYKLEPYQLLGSSLGSTPIDIVHYIINQGYSSEFHLQSIVYGTLHAAKRTGIIQPDLESDLLFGAKLLFRMKHWQELYKQYQKDELNAHAVVNEALNSLMVVLSSERVRSAIDESTKNYPQQNATVDAEAVIIEASNEPALTEKVKAEVAEVADIPEKMTTEVLQKVVTTANEDAVQVIPEFPKQSVLLDIEKVAESALAQKPMQANESRSITLLKSLVEVQKGLNGDYAAQGYFGAFVSALHNEGIIEVTGNIGLNIQTATNNGLVKASQAVEIDGQDLHNRTDDSRTRSQLLTELVNSNFVNLESGIIDAGQALYLTCIGIVENFGELKSLGRIVTTANRIVRNHQSGKIIAKRDVSLLCDLLAKNEGLIIGESVHFEGTLEKAENKGTIIGVDKIRLMSSKLVNNAKGAKLVAKKLDLKGPKVVKEGMIQAEVVETTGQVVQMPESVTWRKDEGDAIGIAKIAVSEHLDADKDAFNNVQIVDVTLPQMPIDSTQPLFDISSDFANTLQLHLPQSDRMIPIWQLPKMSSDATFILDAPGSHLYSGNVPAIIYDSTFRFSGNSFDYSQSQIAFSQPAFFDVSQIQGLGVTSELLLGKGGLIQADVMRNSGHVKSDDILHWNVDLLQNNAELAESTEYFYYSKHNPLLQAHTKTSVIPNSGTIEALGHRGFVGEFSQVGGTFASGIEETYVYYTKSKQEAILTRHGENPTGILHDAGQNWYSKPEWHNSQITSKGRSVLIGEQFVAAGLTFWGDKGSYIHAPKGIEYGVLSQAYEIDQILSLTRHGKVNGVAHEREHGFVTTQNHISSNSGDIVLTAPEGSIHLNNVVLSSAGNATLIAKDQVSINGIAVEKNSSHAYTNKDLLGSKRVQSATHEKLVYSSFIFIGGELIVRCNEFTLDTVQGAIGGNADIVALKNTLKGQQQTYHNTTSIKEFTIGVPGQDLLSIIKGHNAKAVFASIMNHGGWDQSQLDSLLNAKSVAEIPQPLLHTAQNAWNVSALVAHACAELGESPADFVGTFTDKMGLTVVGENKIRQFNPSFTINTSRKTQETHSSQTISSNLLVGGTFRLYGNELHVFDGSTVNAEDLRVFVIEGIKATKGVDSYKSTSQNKHHHLGVSLHNPKDVSASGTKTREVDEQTTTKLAELTARNTAQVNGGALIQGDLKISAPKGGTVTAKVMDFTTSQNTRVLRSHTKQGNVSTGGAVGGSYKSHTLDDATTAEKAGVHLPGGQVLANEIHLANGSKIQAAQLAREDGQLGLPTVSGTAMHDHHKDHQKAVSFSAGLHGEPSADLSRSVKETETVHQPTVIADNVTADSLPGINTQADKETEVVREKSSGFAVAGFIPDKEKFQKDLAAITALRDKGLHWLYGKDSTTPQLVSETITLETAVSETVASEMAASEMAASETVASETAASETVASETVASETVASETVASDRVASGTTAVELAANEESSQGNLVHIPRDSNGRINILITRPPSWTTPTEPAPIEPAPDKSQPSSSIGDTSKFDSFIEHVDAFNRGFEKARDGLVDAAIHPIRTAVETSTLLWDGANAVTDLTVGLSTEGSRDRNEQRVALLHEAAQSFVEGDSVYRTEILSELGASLALGSVTGGVTGGLSRKAATGLPVHTNKAPGNKVASKAHPILSESDPKQKSLTPHYNLRSASKLDQKPTIVEGKSATDKSHSQTSVSAQSAIPSKSGDTSVSKPLTPYAPKRDLPNKRGVGIPDPEAQGVRHTQLGTRERKKYSYTKAREFDEHGIAVRDIEFTDHHRKDHSNPHQHLWTPNETGGTLKRGDAEPLDMNSSLKRGSDKTELPLSVVKPKPSK
jgi:ankyrin repeat protein